MTEPFIRIADLTKRYQEGSETRSVLERAGAEFSRGEFTAILGKSGSGKSTLLNLISGIDRPDGGQIWIDGQELTALDEGRRTLFRRENIGFIFQFFNLIPVLTAVENVSLPMLLDGMKKTAALEKAEAWLQRVGLEARGHHRPDQLSGGQQQRVAIARALVSEPALILADEPTGNLDSRASDEVAAWLRRIVDEYQCTILMVTHDPRIAAYADRIIFLKDGSMVDETRLDGNRAGEAHAAEMKTEKR